METLQFCPICASEKHSLFLTVKDYLLTQKEFNIVACEQCGFRFTNPRPSVNEITEYYNYDTSVRDINKVPLGFMAGKSNSYRLLRIVSSFYKTGSFLDVGSETTAFVDLFKTAKWGFSGIPLKQLLQKQLVDNERGGAGFLGDLAPASVDVISLWHTLERVANVDVLLTELKRALKPNGLIILAASNPSSFDANYFKSNWEAYNVPRNLYHFSPKDIDALFYKHEMRVFRVLPLVYDSYSNSFWSQQNQSGSISVMKSFWIGLRSNIAALKSGKTNSGQLYLIRK